MCHFLKYTFSLYSNLIINHDSKRASLLKTFRVYETSKQMDTLPQSLSLMSNYSVLLILNRLQMEQRVEPLAHNLTLSPLNLNLLLGEGSEEDEESNCIADSPPGPDLGDTRSHLISKVVLSNIEHVGCGVATNEKG